MSLFLDFMNNVRGTPRQGTPRQGRNGRTTNIEEEPKMLAKGSFGCVYPKMKCKQSEDGESNVGKTMLNDTFNHENEKQENMDNIDNTHKYHLEKISDCQIQDINKKIVEGFYNTKDKCLVKNEHGEYKYPTNILITKNGGVNLKMFVRNGFIEDDPKIYDFWYKSHYLILYLVLLNQHKLYHNDLKPENIVFDDSYKYTNPEENNLKVIDFSLMDEKPNTSDYFPYPIEQFLYAENPTLVLLDNFNFVKDLKKGDFKIVFDEENKQHSDYNYSNSTIKHSYFFEYTQHDTYTYDKGKYNSVFEHNFFIGKNYDDLKRAYEETMDIYGMGVVLNYMLKHTGEYIANNRYFLQEMKNLLFRMIHPNCFERIKFPELLHEYRRVLNILTPVFNKHQFDTTGMDSRLSLEGIELEHTIRGGKKKSRQKKSKKSHRRKKTNKNR